MTKQKLSKRLVYNISKRAETIEERNDRLRSSMPGKYIANPSEEYYQPTEEEAREAAFNNPSVFFTGVFGKYFPEIEHQAYDSLIDQEKLGARQYFVFAFQNKQHIDLVTKAVENLIKNTPEAYFSLGLFFDKDLSAYAQQAAYSLFEQDPEKLIHIYKSLVTMDSPISEYNNIMTVMEPIVAPPENNKVAHKLLSIRAGNSYTKKEKTESGGYVWHYSDEHVKKRWADKKKKIEKLEKNLDKVRKEYEKDLSSDDERTRATACIVGVMDTTAMRVGNKESAKEAGTYGATTLKVKHVTFKGNKAHFKFKGKGGIEQDTIAEGAKVTKVLKDLVKGKAQNDFIFETDGFKVSDKAVNRYLKKFDISAKDIRGFHANRLMKEVLKKKDFKEALEEVAETVGHKPATLKNQYLLPELVEKYTKEDKKASLSIRAEYEQVEQSDLGGEELVSEEMDFGLKEDAIQSMPIEQAVDLNRNVSNIRSRAKITPTIATAWKILGPFMPLGAEVSSGFRSERDQAITIKNLWHSSWGGYFAKNFPQYGTSVGSMQKFMTTNYKYIPVNERPAGGPNRVYVSAPGASNHQTGNAMDIHRINNYDRVMKTILWVNRRLKQYVSFVPLKEGDQNNIHVTINKAIYPGPKNMENTLREWYYGKKAPQMYVSQSYSPKLSKRAELSNEETGWIQSMKSRLFSTPTPSSSTYRDQGATSGVRPGVKVNSTILSAWKSLYPFLPKGSIMTSGSRTSDDQKRIINNFWNKATGSGIPEHLKDNENVWEEAARILTKRHGYIVGPPTTKRQYAHLKGNAFDVSGADLNEIARAIRMVTRSNIPVKFRPPLVELKNNAVHVGVESATYNEQAVSSLLSGAQRFASISSREDNVEDDISSVYEDLLKSNPPKEVLELFRGIGNDTNTVEQMVSSASEDKPTAGVFIKLPKEIAKQFPSLGDNDTSVPHITTLFIGVVPKKHEILLEEVVKRVAMEHDPFDMSLDAKVSYFPATEHSDNCKVAKINIISSGLKKLHKELKKAIINAEIDIVDSFPTYIPHTTLEYMAPPKTKYDSDIPSGAWIADKIEIWNGDDKVVIPLGRKKISQRETK